MDSSSAMDAVPALSESMAVPSVSRSLRQLGRQPLEFVQGTGEPLALLAERRQDRVEVVDQLLQRSVVVGQRVRKRRCPGQQRLQPIALALEDLEQRVGEGIDVLRVQTPDHRFEAAEQQVEVERRLGAVRRDLCAASDRPGRSGTVDEFEVPVSDEVEVADHCAGARG